MKRNIGIILIIISVIGIGYSLMFNISLGGTDSFGNSTNRVVNLALLQTKLTYLILSCTMFLAGLLCVFTAPNKIVSNSINN